MNNCKNCFLKSPIKKIECHFCGLKLENCCNDCYDDLECEHFKIFEYSRFALVYRCYKCFLYQHIRKYNLNESIILRHNNEYN